MTAGNRCSMILCLTILIVTIMASNVSGSTRQIMQSNLDFALKIYTQLDTTNRNGNLLLSPFSLSAVMNMLYMGARNNTATEMASVMNIGSFGDTLHSAFQEYIGSLKDNAGNYDLATANRLYAQKMEFLQTEYSSACKTFYHAEIEQVDFKQEAETVRSTINRWVEVQTKNKIRNLIPEGALDPLTVLVIVNAIYFKGDWANQFNAQITRGAPFHLNTNEEVSVEMMFKKDKFNFGEMAELGCSVLELPYKGDHLSMIVMLPDTIDGLQALEKKISSSVLSSIRKNMHEVEVGVNLPKFKLETGFELKDLLSSLGMVDLFDQGKCDLSGIDGSNLLYVSKVIHKAFIEVNEEGTVVTAATDPVFKWRSMEIIMQFNANHPFLFYITDRRSDAVLFIGRFYKPQRNPLQQKGEL